MATVQMLNIQGFRGQHTYNIEDALTVINSVNNGVGKTTLFDCIRMTCDSKLFDKEELSFFLNLHETVGVFTFYNDGITHGFQVERGKPVIFVRREDGEEIEFSYDNFPNAAQDMGILMINGKLLNIFGKDLNLFSSSAGNSNYELVKTITTHAETENALSTIDSSLDLNSQILARIKYDLSVHRTQMGSLIFYPNVEELSELLKDESYEIAETNLQTAIEALKTLNAVDKVNVSYSLEYMLSFLDSLNSLEEVDNFYLDTEPLDRMVTLKESLDAIEEVKALNIKNTSSLDKTLETQELLQNLNSVDSLDVNTESMDKLGSLLDASTLIEPIEKSANLPIDTLELINEVKEHLDSLEPIGIVNTNESCINSMYELYSGLSSMLLRLGEDRRLSSKLSESKSLISSLQIDCPIRKEVFLVDGICVY